VPPETEDPDPLLAFSIEPGAATPKEAPAEAIAQPVVSTRDARHEGQQAPLELLAARVERLERALDESKSRVASLTSEVATLVGLLRDIRKLSRPVAPGVIAPTRAARSSMPGATVIVGLTLGLGLGIFGWMHLAGDADSTIAPPPAVSTQRSVADPTLASVLPIASVTSKLSDAQKAVDVRDSHQAPAPQAQEVPQAPAPQAPRAPRFLGTLSIDADPGGEVFLNRQRAGHTPLRLTNLRAGSHLIWVERDGYRRFTRVVPVPADRVTRLFADLEPIAAR
jgi:hypothetical protein